MQKQIHQALPYSVQAADILRAAILEGKYELGQRLNEVQLSTDLGISRSPLHEGLRTLAQEGLVTAVSGRGVYVTRLVVEDIRDLLELRLVLDGVAARQVAELGGSEDAAKLEKTCDDKALLLPEDVRMSIPECNHGFHLCILDAAKNRKLAEYAGAVHSQIRLIRFRSGSNIARIAEAHDEHLLILKAIQAHDGDEAERSMRIHNEANAQHILRFLEESQHAD